MHRGLHHLLIFVLACLSACAAPEVTRDRFCASPTLLVDALYDGGNFHHCSIDGDAKVSVVIKPEDPPPINPSAWYSFRLSATEPITAEVDIAVTDGYARYWPKISTDGDVWTPLPASAVQAGDDGNSISISLHLGEHPVYVSAQEILQPEDYEGWLSEIGSHPDFSTRLLGRSVLGRPIYVASSGAKPEVVFFLGRQHPPEVSGALAMRAFIDAVLADSALARQFRQRFMIVIVPLLNPDGVAAGHWRHNMNGVDLNRDWGPFTQPETRSVAALLSQLERTDISPVLMLDFHSTRRSLFYTQMPEDFPGTADFATVWLNRARERLPDFEYSHEARKASTQANTKNYFFSRFRIPAITYEIGDEVDRDAIKASTPVFAEEMMRLMLER